MQESGPRTGTRFGPYELRSLLGKGGMGEVYEAYDTVKDREVAVKLLSEELAKDPTYQVRFRRESQAAARLAEPHVIPIHDWGVIDGVLFIDMRLVRGVDLRTLLRSRGPLSPARAVGIIEQVASALDAAHASNLVHRDVKPANILVTDQDFAYLADFGIAHTEGDSAVTLVGMAVGSYIYMAPERFDVGPVTGRADVYSLACVLHECLTGATPFPSASMNVLIKSHLSDPPPRPSTQASGIPAALDEVVQRGMAKDPADRFPTATALAMAARAALTSAAAAGPTLVVRAPDRGQREQAASVAPESTGELSLPSVIRPSAPTVVRPTETQFTPLPSAGPSPHPRSPYPPEVQLPPMRPFPDAHLYPETQAYLEVAGHQGRDFPAPPTQVYPQGVQQPHLSPDFAGSAQPYTDRTEDFAQADPDATRVYPEPSTGRPYPEMPQAYSEALDHAGTQQHPGAGNYPEAGRYPDHPPLSGSVAARDVPDYVPAAESAATRTDYPPRGDYPARTGYPLGREEPEYDYDDYDEPAYAASRPGRSIALPIMVAVFAIVALTVGGAIAWQSFGSDTVETTSAAAHSETSATAVRPSTSTRAPSSTFGRARHVHLGQADPGRPARRREAVRRGTGGLRIVHPVGDRHSRDELRVRRRGAQGLCRTRRGAERGS
ncbi:protein kinase domain-containing protein [Nocardia asteroides]